MSVNRKSLALPGEQALQALGLRVTQPAPNTSVAGFPDGGVFRLEIPSVEGPNALAEVISQARLLDVPVHRVSQGSGVMMLSDAEITEMVGASAEAGIELCLFLGPRASWDIGAGRFTVGGGCGPRARGRDQLGQALADAYRAVALGVRCLLVADEGVLWAVHQLRSAGQLPAEVKLKVSALAGPVNPASFRVFEQLGADSINIPSDLTIAQVAELRAAGTAAIDFYLETPDDLGGYVRNYDAAELIRVGAPIYLKFGLRNAPNIYPAGDHLAAVVVDSARERVRRAHLCVQRLAESGLLSAASPAGSRVMPSPRRFVSESV
ncbi:MAG TPA: hypothetical protein VHX38_04165 [Pseudonocardiaceae bacterium]|jgi:hypothetical protein|nr:hypothetical protein [Pseudonocardiaceae bacterium]